MSLSLDKLKNIFDVDMCTGGIERYDGLPQTFELSDTPNTTLLFKTNSSVFQLVSFEIHVSNGMKLVLNLRNVDATDRSQKHSSWLQAKESFPYGEDKSARVLWKHVS